MKRAFLIVTAAIFISSVFAPMPIQAATEPAPETLHLRVTAYTSLADETDSTPFITASGETVRDGIVATNLLPFGTRIMIPTLFGDKIFTVEDRMNQKMKDSLDIWMPTYGKAIYFGVHYDTEIVIVGTSTNAVAVAMATAK